MSLCRRCGRFYVEFDNIGTWKCRVHPDPYDVVNDMYPCCKKRIKEVPTNDLGRFQFNWKPLPQAPDVCGCVRCDCTDGSAELESVSLEKIAEMIDASSEDMNKLIEEIKSRPGYSLEKNMIYRDSSTKNYEEL